jgi:prolipoprotein diacylglyceryltransferase
VYRKWNRVTRWHSLDGYAYGLTIGLGIGRIACTSVGEHFGRMSHFFLAVRYDGGSVREPTLGGLPLQKGMEFHNTAIYELIYLVLFFLFLSWLLYGRKQRPPVGTILGLFCLYYGVMRFASDSLRVNDHRVLHLTGAQYLCLALVPTGIWILRRVRRLLAEDIAAGDRPGLGGEPVTEGVEAPAHEPG